jgi:hypothetical protein
MQTPSESGRECHCLIPIGGSTSSSRPAKPHSSAPAASATVARDNRPHRPRSFGFTTSRARSICSQRSGEMPARLGVQALPQRERLPAEYSLLRT